MKSTLRLKQEQFSVEIAKLIIWASENGINASIGDAFRDPRVHGQIGESKGYGHKNSCHKLKLAVDLNLDNVADHSRLHDQWDKQGGAERIPADLNHYSFSWQGMR